MANPARFLLRLLALGTASALTGFAAAPKPVAPPAPAAPNIIVILADDIGWGDASCYGATKISTPNIDRLAREGRRFDNGYSSAAVCTPTRYSLITGEYGWRGSSIGVNRGVANGASPLLIPTDRPTAPGLLQQAGYRTAIIGKWHLGFGLEKPDYNKELRPGPLEVGFHEYFGIPATNDRIPTVLVRNYLVQGLDPADPISYTYVKAEAEASGLSPWAAGRNRIGWAKGGKSAWWNDATLADIHTRESIEFIERNKDNKFFLYFAPHNVHAPKIPGSRFKGRSGLGDRADMLLEFDSSLGELLGSLDKLGLANNTLLIYSSDNGAYLNDEAGHRPTGPFRGIKSTLWEGGSRVPFIVRWPARITPGESSDLVSTLDVPATVCAAAGITPPEDALPDSFNLLPSLLGQKDASRRDFLILQSGNGKLAVRSGPWKYIPDLDTVEGWKSKAKADGAPERPGLFDLLSDPGEKQNLHAQNPAESRRIAAQLAAAMAAPRTRP
jgi:arylsulfatase A-like enzyme